MKCTLVGLGLLILLVGCSIYEDTNITCTKRINWTEDEYYHCEVWISKHTNSGELRHLESMDCRGGGLLFCCEGIKIYLTQNKNSSVYYNSIEDINQIPCKERRWWSLS